MRMMDMKICRSLTLTGVLLWAACDNGPNFAKTDFSASEVFQVEEATGELEYLTGRNVNCTCSYSRESGEIQFLCDQRGMDLNSMLAFYVVPPFQHNLRENIGFAIQAGFTQAPMALSGYGMATGRLEWGANLDQDPCSDIYSTIWFPFFIHRLNIPPQTVCSVESTEVCRELQPSLLKGGAFWCKDYDATIENMLSGEKPESMPAQSVQVWDAPRLAREQSLLLREMREEALLLWDRDSSLPPHTVATASAGRVPR